VPSKWEQKKVHSPFHLSPVILDHSLYLFSISFSKDLTAWIMNVLLLFSFKTLYTGSFK
jgi:hypothetical protein